MKERICPVCQRSIIGRRKSAKYCSDRCRQRNQQLKIMARDAPERVAELTAYYLEDARKAEALELAEEEQRELFSEKDQPIARPSVQNSRRAAARITSVVTPPPAMGPCPARCPDCGRLWRTGGSCRGCGRSFAAAMF